METTILGIIGDQMILAPLYGGDNEHSYTISKNEKDDLIRVGVKEYTDYDYIDAQVYGKTYEEYMEYKTGHEERIAREKANPPVLLSGGFDNNLPF